MFQKTNISVIVTLFFLFCMNKKNVNFMEKSSYCKAKQSLKIMKENGLVLTLTLISNFSSVFRFSDTFISFN